MKHSHPCAPFVFRPLALSVMLCFAAGVQAAPAGGAVAAGAATIATSGSATTITQSTANLVVNWQSFGIAAGESVRFAQPGTNSVALNRVVGSDPSAIFGSLSSNGKVFLVNPNGILFGSGASVNVGGLVASTLNVADTDFMAGRYSFANAGSGAVVNQGAINAPGGYVALLANNVSNQGVISARLGSVALAAGNAITLDIAGDNLLNVTVDQGAVNALVANGGLIRADGGHVLLTTQAAGSLFASVVNNTGVIQAQTISTRNGTIRLMGGMQAGAVDVAGTLDASAPDGGNGGFIETSAARVDVQAGARITTAAASGLTGNWLIDPQDFTIGSGGNISGPTLSGMLVTSSVTISTTTGADAAVAGTPPLTNLHTATAGNGDIIVNQAVSWTASSSPTTLTLNAERDVNINAAVTATNGNFAVCCGRDVNVNAAITTTNGSILLSAGRHANLNATGAMTTTDGNMMVCAAENVNVGLAIVLRRGSSIPAQSLGLPLGLVLSAGTGGTGPGIAGGTVVFAPLAPIAEVTGPNAPVTINYNPVSYTTPTDYLPRFTLVTSSLTQHMLVFAAGGDKTFDGSTATTLTSLKGSPAGVTLVAGVAAVANFDSAAVGTLKPISFTGYTLGGSNPGAYALPVTCCGVIAAKTTGTVLAAVAPPPPAPAPVPAPPAPVPAPPAPAPVPAPPAPVPAPPAPAPLPPAPPPVVVPAPVVEGTPPSEIVTVQFAPFVVAPLLLRPPPVLTIAPASLSPVALVVQEAPAPAPEQLVVAPPQPPVPPLVPRFVPKPYRN